MSYKLSTSNVWDFLDICTFLYFFIRCIKSCCRGLELLRISWTFKTNQRISASRAWLKGGNLCLSVFVRYGTCFVHVMSWKSSRFLMKPFSSSPFFLLTSNIKNNFLFHMLLLIFKCGWFFHLWNSYIQGIIYIYQFFDRSCPNLY